MSRAKIPRKSTHIDMTAMCDVAFLLLSFFILATKTKPPEAVAVITPNSVSTKVAKEEAILVTLTKEGKVFLMLGDKAHKNAIIDDINTTKGLNLSGAEIAKLRKIDFIGVPFNQLKSFLDLATTPPPQQMPGIPCVDSTNNELTDWIRSVANAYKGENMDNLNLLVKGDNAAFYPAFKSIKESFKKNDIYKFKIVTNSEPPPPGSELEKEALQKK
ncbi:biopolymer transporter ExbD [Ferruginibacter sp.]|uniref:ExbD/TolR family protein n=1 Tax=Ferruginibacter sp. TaxID=1940288 RepID=UPI00198B1BD4|nr:biopolymer transporter ExbD [Ferruginibacter sp.]MBC7628595.1 biopolymer transporter ExbD [Ferruginibacter sp.]